MGPWAPTQHSMDWQRSNKSRKTMLWSRCLGSWIHLNPFQQACKKNIGCQAERKCCGQGATVPGSTWAHLSKYIRKDRHIQKPAFGDFMIFLCVCCVWCVWLMGLKALWAYGPMCSHLAFARMTKKQQKHVVLWVHEPMGPHPTFNGLTKKQFTNTWWLDKEAAKQNQSVVASVPRFLNPPELTPTSKQKTVGAKQKESVVAKVQRFLANLSSSQQVLKKPWAWA